MIDMASTHTLKIDFTLDTICPFTYLGRRKLQFAIRLAQEQDLPVTFNILYLPYDIGKNLSKAGRNKKEWYLEKTGGNEEHLLKMIEVMKSMGKEIGIDFSYEGEVANTLDTHRVIKKIQTEKLGDVEKLMDSLYLQYFEQAQHPSSKATLLTACKAAGVQDIDSMSVFIDSDALEDEVKESIVEQNMTGIDGVPAMVFEGRRRDFTLVGAKSPQEYLNTIKQVLKEL